MIVEGEHIVLLDAKIRILRLGCKPYALYCIYCLFDCLNPTYFMFKCIINVLNLMFCPCKPSAALTGDGRCLSSQM